MGRVTMENNKQSCQRLGGIEDELLQGIPSSYRADVSRVVVMSNLCHLRVRACRVKAKQDSHNSEAAAFLLGGGCLEGGLLEILFPGSS